jgi:hypothetical protein
MGFWKTFFTAFNKARAESRLLKEQTKLHSTLCDDAITLDLIKKICKEFQYHFEITRPDGTIFRFYKRVDDTYEDLTENDGWGR